MVCEREHQKVIAESITRNEIEWNETVQQLVDDGKALMDGKNITFHRR